MLVLKQHDHGPDVVKLQQDLNQLGFVLTEDGIFGGKTFFAVITLQTIFGLEVTVDGKVGDETRGLIDEQIARGWNLVTARLAFGAPDEAAEEQWTGVSDAMLAELEETLKSASG